MYSVIYTSDAKNDLKKLSNKTAQRIIKKIEFYALQSDIRSFSKSLQGFKSKYRFRIGEYRAIFSIDSSGVIQILFILRIDNRKDVYDL